MLDRDRSSLLDKRSVIYFKSIKNQIFIYLNATSFKDNLFISLKLWASIILNYLVNGFKMIS